SVRVAGPVYHHHDKSEFGKCLMVAARCGKRTRTNTSGLRARIDVVDDRILFRAVEVCRCEHQAVKVPLAVARLNLDRRWRLPTRSLQTRHVGLLEFSDLFAV